MSTVQGGQGNIVTNGLILNLDAANPRSYPQPYNGTTWQNIAPVSSSLTGSLVNGVAYTGSNGGALVFDGVNDYVGLGDNLILDITKSFTISSFFNLNLYNNTYPTLFTIKTSTGNSLVLLITLDGGYAPLTFGWNGTNTYKPSGTISLNKWYNISLTYNGNGISSFSNFNLYINNTLQTLSAANTFGGIGQVNTLGTLNTGTANFYFNGNIASTQLYNRALNASEVLQNFNATRARFGV
jgi:hypothetical protein